MKWIANLSFVSRIGLAMAMSLLLNLGMGYFLKNRLSQPEYILNVAVEYDSEGSMELHFDTGRNFNTIQEAVVMVSNGNNSLTFPINLKDGEQLKFLRLDFGNNPELSQVHLKSLSLSSKENVLFDLGEKEIARQIGLLQGVEQADIGALFKLNTAMRPFDPYVVFSPVNELITPLWQRTLMLVVPWIIFFLFPVLGWIRKRFEKKEFALFLAALFIVSVPLKIAWVTFTALLLLAYSIFVLVKNKEIRFSPGSLAVLGLFVVPLLFVGQGELSNLAIPLGFVIFPIICSILDFSLHDDEIKKIYTKVFLITMSIVIVSWVLRIGYEGYFYNLDFSNYFTDIKSNAHLVMYWLYYPHTTFLSFFALIGGIFCMDLYKREKITQIYGLAYVGLTIIALIILGSRFAWVLAILLPVLFFIPLKNLKKILVPLWAALFTGTVYFIDKMDVLRTELWQISFTEIKKNLWFGNGTGNSDLVLPDQLLISKNGADMLIEINHSHNQFLTNLLENGLLGTLLFTALMLFIFLRFSQLNNKAMMLVTFAILLLMIVESPFKTATPLYLCGFLWCVFKNRDENQEERLANNL